MDGAGRSDTHQLTLHRWWRVVGESRRWPPSSSSSSSSDRNDSSSSEADAEAARATSREECMSVLGGESCRALCRYIH